jgi:AbrB family looped-hinge helix DNA binding protein
MSQQIQITMDSSGRVLIPKAIRSRLGLSPGARFIVEERDAKEILLRPVPQEPRLTDKGGVLVVRSQAVGDIAEAVKESRFARLSELVRRA